MIIRRRTENAHKFAFLVSHYDKLVKQFPEIVERFPDNRLQQILAMLALPSIDINAAIWYSADLGLTTTPNKDTGQVEFIVSPDQWILGDNIDTLSDTIVYAFTKLGERETDLEEHMVQDWLTGYAVHDSFIALNLLLSKRILATYELTDPEDLKSTYTFYTLAENSEQMWGRKSFKKQPTGEEKSDNNNDKE